jgi:hypothetical protein
MYRWRPAGTFLVVWNFLLEILLLQGPKELKMIGFDLLQGVHQRRWDRIAKPFWRALLHPLVDARRSCLTCGIARKRHDSLYHIRVRK